MQRDGIGEDSSLSALQIVQKPQRKAENLTFRYIIWLLFLTWEGRFLKILAVEVGKLVASPILHSQDSTRPF